MWALYQFRDARSKQTSIDALASDDVALRALAAANLGKLRVAEATPALLGLLPRTGGDERDRAMALLALADIGDPAPLLQAAAAVGDGDAMTLQALAYAFQTLSPKLTGKDEATTLVAALDHPQKILRRYAIQRLGELRDPATARALEGRLGREDRELLPLVQVSLQAVRRDTSGEQRSIGESLTALATRARATWQQLAPNHRYAALAGIGAIIVLLLLVSVIRRHARSQAQGVAWAAMATPAAAGRASARAPAPDTGDEVDLTVGDSGVYSPHDHDDDALLQSKTGQFTGSHR
jgi:HEAT repeat protein